MHEGHHFLERNVSDSLWTHTSAETFSSGELEEHVDVDLVIIGGGYTGLSAALDAAERGARTAVVEARHVGYGGSGRNVGLVNAGLWVPPEDINALLGTTIGNRLTGILGSAPDMVYGLIEKHGMACDPVRAGTLHCAHSKAGLEDLKSRFAQLKSIGSPVSLLDAEETGKRTGADGLFGALFDPRAGMIQPLAYAQGLARAAVDAGAQIYENTPALSTGWEDGSWEISTPKGLVRAPSLLLASNAYPFRMSWVPTMKSIPVSYFQVSTAKLTDEQRATVLSGGEGCWDTGLIMSSWRLDAAGRLIIGGMGNLRHFAGGIHESWIQRKIASLYPSLKGIAIEHIWQGRIAMTSEKIPKIWRIGPKAYACFGYSGRGIAPGTVFGQRVAASMLEETEELMPVVPVNENAIQAPRIKGTFFEAGATLTHLVKNRF